LASNENKTKVAILTGAFQIKGYIDLLPGARITDFMDSAKDFVAVTDAEVYEIKDGVRHILSTTFLDVSRGHIQIVTPL